jgi:hypothetical protein
MVAAAVAVMAAACCASSASGGDSDAVCAGAEPGVRLHVEPASMKAVDAADPAACCRACVAPACVTWSYGWPSSSRRCHLSFAPPAKRFVDPAFTSGVWNGTGPPPVPAAGSRPHVVFMLADDIGYGNLGWLRRRGGGSIPEVATPNMDSLVRSGINLGRHYTYKVCSPTRSSFQSGRLPVHVNDVNADPAVYNAADPVSGFAGIPRNMTCIANKLKLAGYATHQVRSDAPSPGARVDLLGAPACRLASGMWGWRRWTTPQEVVATTAPSGIFIVSAPAPTGGPGWCPVGHGAHHHLPCSSSRCRPMGALQASRTCWLARVAGVSEAVTEITIHFC